MTELEKIDAHNRTMLLVVVIMILGLALGYAAEKMDGRGKWALFTLGMGAFAISYITLEINRDPRLPEAEQN